MSVRAFAHTESICQTCDQHTDQRMTRAAVETHCAKTHTTRLADPRAGRNGVVLLLQAIGQRRTAVLHTGLG